MRDLSNCEITMKAYTGQSCQKIGVIDKGTEYLIKCPGNVLGKYVRDVQSGQENDVFAEYVASHVMSLFLPAQETEIVKYNGNVCVACKDFEQDGSRLYTYGAMKATMAHVKEGLTDSICDYNNTRLVDVKFVVQNSLLLKKIPDMLTNFWKMFIVDALNGNTGRCNSSWGVLVKKSDDVELAPIYGNSSALNSYMTDNQMSCYMNNSSYFENVVVDDCLCSFTKGKTTRINPLKYDTNKDCNKVLRSMHFGEDVLAEIRDIVDSTPGITDVRKDLYKRVYRIRMELLVRLQGYAATKRGR